MADYDIIGNIAIIKGEGKTKKELLEQAGKLLKTPGVKTVLEKAGNISGRLRTVRLKHILGEENLIAIYKENNCVFKFNAATCYFSPRMANERKLTAMKIRKKDKVLVMFAGIGVFPIIIYKVKKPKKIMGIEINKECCKYFKENLRLNKISPYSVEIIQGDVKKKVNSSLGKFDVVVMARPNLKYSFLKEALVSSKKGTKIFYHGFCKDNKINNLIDKLIEEAKKYKRKIKLKKVVTAGDIAPYKHRFRIEFEVVK